MPAGLVLVYVGGALLGGLGMYFGIGGLFELVYYRRRRATPERWKCQPRRFAPARLRKQEILLGSVNLIAGSTLSGLFAAYVASGGASSIYFDLERHGIVFSLATALVYFLATDCALYWAHRIYHRPALFRAIHRWHHRNTSPSAFTSAAMHPIEFLTYQGIMLAPLFFL